MNKVVRLSSFLPFLISVACTAKPTVPSRAVTEAPSKVTRESDTPPVLEFWSVWESGPPALESAILTHPPIVFCLSDHVRLADTGRLTVQLNGRLNAKGRVQDPTAEGGSAALTACLKAALGNLTTVAGSATTFRLKILRGQAMPPGAKPFAIELKATKKFE